MSSPALNITPSQGTPAIVAEGLGKCYRVYERPGDRLLEIVTRRFGSTRSREFWALRDCSFAVQPGEALGILGRNGSGKSTLLQMIAGTLTPTAGSCRVHGRIAALLELASGFNPEFTGRENVYLNGAILGISRAEMDERFDEILAFSEIEAFIDQPVKTYSSGMHARLAFSVAISVRPDILVLDEILAVGDIGFQHKCLAKLRQMREAGLTLLFVSHWPDAVKGLCQKSLVLIDGTQAFFGSAEEGVNRYLAHVREHANEQALSEHKDLHAPPTTASPTTTAATPSTNGLHRYGTGHARIERVELFNDADQPNRMFALGDDITLELEYRAHTDLEGLNASFLVRDAAGVDLLGTTSFDENTPLPAISAGQTARVRFQWTNRLRDGSYGVCVALTRVARKDYGDNVLLDQIDAAIAFGVLADPSRPVHYKYHEPVRIQAQPSAPTRR